MAAAYLKGRIPTDFNSAPVDSNCTGKDRFNSKNMALKVAKRQNRNDNALNVYKCSSCNNYHIGTPSLFKVK